MATPNVANARIVFLTFILLKAPGASAAQLKDPPLADKSILGRLHATERQSYWLFRGLAEAGYVGFPRKAAISDWQLSKEDIGLVCEHTVQHTVEGATMGRLVWTGVLACALSGAAISANRSDELKIRVLEQEQAVSWNAHDIGGYAALFTADATVVNVLGWQWHSQAELQQKLGQAFRSVFARSRMTIGAVSVRFLKPDVAVAHVRWTMIGAMSPTGAGSDIPQQGIQTQVLVRRAGTWRITDFQNTNSVPEKAFPRER